MRTILALDQGTTSSRAIVFSEEGAPLATGQREFRQIFPEPGWVEHDPREILTTQREVAREALRGAGAPAKDVMAIGITNQRETTLLWDRQTGEPVHNAIVWQDRRTAQICARLKAEEAEDMIRSRHYSPEYSVSRALRKYAKVFESLGGEYMRVGEEPPLKEEGEGAALASCTA